MAINRGGHQTPCLTIGTYGLDSDAVPLPGRLRKLALPFFSEKTLVERQGRDGAFLFLEATQPD